jgi:hypothetical protein
MDLLHGVQIKAIRPILNQKQDKTKLSTNFSVDKNISRLSSTFRSVKNTHTT